MVWLDCISNSVLEEKFKELEKQLVQDESRKELEDERKNKNISSGHYI